MKIAKFALVSAMLFVSFYLLKRKVAPKVYIDSRNDIVKSLAKVDAKHGGVFRRLAK